MYQETLSVKKGYYYVVKLDYVNGKGHRNGISTGLPQKGTSVELRMNLSIAKTFEPLQ